jgi:hypothetical protein
MPGWYSIKMRELPPLTEGSTSAVEIKLAEDSADQNP